MAGKENQRLKLWMSGGLRHASDEEEKGAVTSGERKLEEDATAVVEDGISSKGEGMAPTAAAATAMAVAAIGEDEPPAADNLVEMPLESVRWILAQKREDNPVPTLGDYNPKNPEELAHAQERIRNLQLLQDEFFDFQARVRKCFDEYGVVMVSADVVGPKDELQEAIDELWDRAMKESDDAEEAELAVTSSF